MSSRNEELEFIRRQISILRVREQELTLRRYIDVPRGHYSCHICRTSLSFPLGHLSYPPQPIECPICKENTDPILVLSCGHFICSECFKGFFGLSYTSLSIVSSLMETHDGNLVEREESNTITRFTSISISLIFFDSRTETVSIKFLSTPGTTYIYRIQDIERWRRIVANIRERSEGNRESIGMQINNYIRDASLLLLIGRTSVYHDINDLNRLGMTVYNMINEEVVRDSEVVRD